MAQEKHTNYGHLPKLILYRADMFCKAALNQFHSQKHNVDSPPFYLLKLPNPPANSAVIFFIHHTTRYFQTDVQSVFREGSNFEWVIQLYFEKRCG